MNIARALAVSGVLIALAAVPPEAAARDRPGTPTDVLASVYETPLERLPRVTLRWRNTATEEVSFSVEWTENGAPINEYLGDRLDCVSRSAQAYYCNPLTLYRHKRAVGHATTWDREWPHNVVFINLKFNSRYCFRLIARDVDMVFSEQWSAWTCTDTPSPPPMPQAPEKAQLTLLSGESGRSAVGTSTPPRALVEWISPLDSRNVAWFVIEQLRNGRWTDDIEGRGLVRTRGGGSRDEREVVFDLLSEVTDPKNNAPRFRVCSVNVMGRACTNAVAELLLQTATAATPIGSARAAAQPIATRPDDIPQPTQTRSADVSRGGTPLQQSPQSSAVATPPLEVRDNADSARETAGQREERLKRMLEQTREQQEELDKKDDGLLDYVAGWLVGGRSRPAKVDGTAASTAEADAARSAAPAASPPANGVIQRPRTVIYQPSTRVQTSVAGGNPLPLQRSASSNVPPELAEEAAGKELLELLCRGGGLHRLNAVATDPAITRLQPASRPPASARFMLVFQTPPRNAAGSSAPAGRDGSNLQPSQCSFANREFAVDDPPGMLFDAVAGDDIASRLTDQSRFWTFTVFETNYGHFRAVGYSPLTAPASAADDGGGIPAYLFELEDGARIAVSGEPTTAGQLKNALRAQMLEESGAPQPVQARHSNDTAIAGTTNTATVTRHTAPATVSQAAIQQTQTATARQAGSTLSPATQIGGVASSGRFSSAALGVDCSGQAPRVLQVLDGPRAGQPFAIEGTCLGSSHGTIQLIGLATGPLEVAFTSWTENSIAALMPSVSGVQDQRLSLTVIRNPDRRTSPPREVRFEAARETVRVPAERWTPLTRVHKAAVFQGETPMPNQTAEFQVHVNPACALDTVAANPRLGSIVSIRGWGEGPPDRASVAMDWKHYCVATRSAVPPASIRWDRVCEVDFDVEATASCPTGVKP